MDALDVIADSPVTTSSSGTRSRLGYPPVSHCCLLAFLRTGPVTVFAPHANL